MSSERHMHARKTSRWVMRHLGLLTGAHLLSHLSHHRITASSAGPVSPARSMTFCLLPVA